MSKFIGVKMVEAVPMTAQTAKSKGYKVSTNHYYTNNNSQDKQFIDYDFNEGYEVTYPDGYKSWCPKDVFEASYYQIQDSNGEMIYRNDVEGFINKVESIKIGAKTTNTTITCLTGYKINAQSSCVKPENYNTEIGEQIAKPKAMDSIWTYLGFVLQWAKYGLNR